MNNYNDPLKKVAEVFASEYWLSELQTSKKMIDVLKFHQKTTWQNVGDNFMSAPLVAWLELVQNKDVLPEYYLESIPIQIEKIEKTEGDSKRNYNQEITYNFKEIGKILYDSFGRAEKSKTKNYASAGALYPIIPLLVILKEDMFDKDLLPGCYVFDSHNNQLLLLKRFSENEILRVCENIYTEKLSDMFIAYALDIRRATAKYRNRGYRHGLIEVGLMAQNFKISLQSYKNYGECLWSGFNDNSLTNLLGMNPRLSPLLLLQWFGKIK